MINHILDENPLEGDSLCVSDLDYNGTTNISDIILTVQLILN